MKNYFKKFNFYLAAAASSWVLLILIIFTEVSTNFKSILQAFFWHHWIAKILLTVFVFVAAGFLFKNINLIKKHSVKTIAWDSILVTLAIILLFYLMNFFLKVF